MRPHPVLLSGFFALALACSDPNELPNASQLNFEDTLTIYALDQTPIQVPSAYSVTDGPVRTDRTSAFEFAYQLGPANERMFIPQQALGIQVQNTIDPGLFPRPGITFESITRAASNGYITDDTVAADSGMVYLVRSRLVCSIGVSQYAKIQVLSFDDAQRSVTFRVIADNNCGYRGLKPGIPTD